MQRRPGLIGCHFEEAIKAGQNPVQQRAAVGCTSVQGAEADKPQVVGIPKFADMGGALLQCPATWRKGTNGR